MSSEGGNIQDKKMIKEPKSWRDVEMGAGFWARRKMEEDERCDELQTKKAHFLV